MGHPQSSAPREVVFDVIVIGGGPSGSAAAITCAELGLRTAVLEASVGPRDRPGETLHPGIEPLLAQLGVLRSVQQACTIRPVGLWLNDQFEDYGKDSDGSAWQGFQLPRRIFDEILLMRASENAQLFRGCVSRKFHKDELWHLSTSVGPLRGRVLIDASGAARWLSRKLDLKVDICGPPGWVKYGFAWGRPALPDCYLRTLPDGWLWTARLSGNLRSWCKLEVGLGSRNAPEIPGLKIFGKISKSTSRWHCVKQLAGDKFFLSGDSAFSLDPGSGKGVLRALMTGILAANCTKQLLGGHKAKQIEFGYRGYLRTWFHKERQQLSARYASIFAHH